jgi:hypothetical protein
MVLFIIFEFWITFIIPNIVLYGAVHHISAEGGEGELIKRDQIRLPLAVHRGAFDFF